jgi:hypothetical protein
MEEKPFEEKRTYSRYEGVYAEYAVTTSEFEDKRFLEFQTCFLRNFSLEGASLHITKPVADNPYIYLHLYDPEHPKPILLVGEVVWCEYAGANQGPNAAKRCNIGIKFKHIAAENKPRLNNLLVRMEALRPKRKGPIDYV